MTATSLGYTPGSGAEVATDQDSLNRHHQKALTEFLLAGEPTPVSEAAPMPVADGVAGGFLFRILQALLSPLGYDKSLGRFRQTAIIESGTVTTVSTVTTVTTCSTVSSLSNVAAIGGYSAQMQVMDTNRMAWAQSVGSRIY